MTCYAVYLETADDGLCMAHVPSLPGCMVRGVSRQEVLQLLPEVIHEYHAWLRCHGEQAPAAEEAVEVEIAGESTGLGPFDPGDAAVLLPTDRELLTLEELERFLCLMAHSRTDLLAIVQVLSTVDRRSGLELVLRDDLLDWQPDPQSFHLRRLLRHVGNAEKWYVSRVVPPETLPAEWDDDEHLPPLEYLQMVRQTAVARLRQLTAEQRAGISYPAHRTSHPDEAWTARKVLRRFLEHEREHTVQARDILAARRRHVMADLSAERAQLWEQLLGLDERALNAVPILNDWTIQDLLAHVAAWDRWEHRSMLSLAAGDTPDVAVLQDLEAANGIFVDQWRHRTLEEVVTELQAAREDWVAWLESLTESEFFCHRSHAGCDWTFDRGPLQVQMKHDRQHTAEIARWREAKGFQWTNGPKSILVASLRGAREELLASAAVVPVDEQTSRAVCGSWTLRDVLGHVADWEWVGVEGLRHMAAGAVPDVEQIEDIDAWNEAHARARHGQSMDVVWADLHAVREAFLELLEGMSQTELGGSFPFPWGPEGTPYEWICVFAAHDREHARGLRMREGRR